MTKILVVEDQLDIANLIKINIRLGVNNENYLTIRVREQIKAGTLWSV